MLRLSALRLFFLVACLAVGLPCFAEESESFLKEWQSESLTYIGNGNAHLLAHEPWQALENYQKANEFLDLTDNSSFVLGFLISFGQAVAYDCLGFHGKCKQAIGSLFFAINGYDSEEPAGVDQNPDSNSHEYESSVQFLRDLAAIAPSLEVRELLFSIIDDIESELHPSFEFAKSAHLGNGDWTFDYGTDNVSITQCKSFYKKFIKFLNKICEALHIIDKTTKAMKEINQNFQDLKRSSQYNDPRYASPGYRIK